MPRALVARLGCASQEFVPGAACCAPTKATLGARSTSAQKLGFFVDAGRRLAAEAFRAYSLRLFPDGGLEGFGGDGGSVAFQFGEQDAEEYERGSEQDSASKMFSCEKPGSYCSEYGFQADQDCGVRWRSVLLGPGLEREADGSRSDCGDENCEDQSTSGNEARRFPTCDSQQWQSDGSENRRGGNLYHCQSADGVGADVATDENHVNGKHHGAAKNDGVAAIQSTQAFRRNSEEIETDERRESARPYPYIQAASREQSQKKRNDDDTRSGDEGSLRRSCVFQPASLKNVGGEHAQSDLDAGPNRLSAERPKRTPKKYRHYDTG